MVFFLLLSLVIGVLAAVLIPARRAARLDVLQGHRDRVSRCGLDRTGHAFTRTGELAFSGSYPRDGNGARQSGDERPRPGLVWLHE